MHDLLHQQDSSKSQMDEELLDVDILLDQLLQCTSPPVRGNDEERVAHPDLVHVCSL